jgi:hypothetical protein
MAAANLLRKGRIVIARLGRAIRYSSWLPLLRHAFRPHDLTAYRAIEEQLAHRNSLAEVSGISAKSSGPYDRNKMPAMRAELMQWWADRVDVMRDGARLRLVV